MHQKRAGPRHLSREFDGSRKEIQESGPDRVIQDFMGIFFKGFFPAHYVGHCSWVMKNPGL